MGSLLLLQRSPALEMVLSLSLCSYDFWYRWKHCLKLSQWQGHHWQVRDWWELFRNQRPIHPLPAAFLDHANQEYRLAALFLWSDRKEWAKGVLSIGLWHRFEWPCTSMGGCMLDSVLWWKDIHWAGDSNACLSTLEPGRKNKESDILFLQIF